MAYQVITLRGPSFGPFIYLVIFYKPGNIIIVLALFIISQKWWLYKMYFVTITVGINLNYVFTVYDF